MQMLHAGGMELLTDGVRRSDEDNPAGYFEYEAVKRLSSDQSWLAHADDKALKVIAQLVQYLPTIYQYQVIVVERDMREIMASQTAMLDRQGRSGPSITNEALGQVFQSQLDRAMAWLQIQSNIRLFNVSHRSLLESTTPAVLRLAAFFDQRLDVEAMIDVIDPRLNRQRLV